MGRVKQAQVLPDGAIAEYVSERDRIVHQREEPTEEDWRGVPRGERLHLFRERMRVQADFLALERENDEKADEKFKQRLKDSQLLQLLQIQQAAVEQLLSGEEDFVYVDRILGPQTQVVPLRTKSRKDLVDIVAKTTEIVADLAGLHSPSHGGTTVNVTVNTLREAARDVDAWEKEYLKNMEVEMAVLPSSSAPMMELQQAPTREESWPEVEPPNATADLRSMPAVESVLSTSRPVTVT